jgi:hypothetical protein
MKRIALMFILSSCPLIRAWAEEPVHFVDPNLQAAVESALAIGSPTPSDMLGLTSLRAPWRGITNLTGLEYALNLRELVLREDNVRDISPLGGLTNLETLNLSVNDIHDISPLAGLTKLRTLDIHENRAVSDISVLAGLTNLEVAILRHLQVSNLTPLAGLNKLKELDLYENCISDISPLAGLTSLRLLDLRVNILNAQSYNVYIPLIQQNNPGLSLKYDNYSSPSSYRVTISATAGGAVTNPGQGQFTYEDGATIWLRAEADPGFTFAGWSGGVTDTRNPLFVTVSGNMQIQANFLALLGVLHVDDDAPGDPAPGDPTRSDPLEDGSPAHPFDSIQQAIQVAAPGDSILVHPGTYREHIDLLGKDLHLTGTAPDDPAGTGYPVLTGVGKGPLVSFRSGETPACTLIGFVLTGGQGTSAAALYCAKSDPTIAHCLLVGNRAADPNGAAAYFVYSRAVLNHCTIADNDAGAPGAGVTMLHSDVVLNHSILWGNHPQDLLVLGVSRPTLRYCDLPGSWPEAGNLNQNPLFARRGYWADANDPAVILGPQDARALWMAGDYHLQSQTGRWNPQTRTWVQDQLNSPCLDAGDPAAPADHEPAPNGGRINLGVYGGTTEASMSR